jgi:hypothetical protein
VKEKKVFVVSDGEEGSEEEEEEIEFLEFGPLSFRPPLLSECDEE